jgi:hypothetical protein
MARADVPAIEQIFANTINETARGDPEALGARIVAALGEGRLPHSPGEWDRGHRARFAALRRTDARNAAAGHPRRRPGLDVQDL